MMSDDALATPCPSCGAEARALSSCPACGEFVPAAKQSEPVELPNMCRTHQVLLVRQCSYGPDDPWRALYIASQIALFQGITCDPNVIDEAGGQVENLSRLGCLACRRPDLFGQLIDTVRRTPLWAHIGAIKRLGERWIGDALARGPRP